MLDGKNAKHEAELEVFILEPEKSKLRPNRLIFSQLEELRTKLSAEKDRRTILKQKYVFFLLSIFIYSFFLQGTWMALTNYIHHCKFRQQMKRGVHLRLKTSKEFQPT